MMRVTFLYCGNLGSGNSEDEYTCMVAYVVQVTVYRRSGGDGGSDGRAPEEKGTTSYFHAALEYWRELNCAADFIELLDAASPLAQTFGELLLHRRKVMVHGQCGQVDVGLCIGKVEEQCCRFLFPIKRGVASRLCPSPGCAYTVFLSLPFFCFRQIFELIIERVNLEASLSLPAILSLLSAFSRDLREEFKEFLYPSIDAIVALLARDEAPMDPDAVEAAFGALCSIFKYQRLQLMADKQALRRLCDRLWPLWLHKKRQFRKLNAQAVGYLVRHANDAQLSPVLNWWAEAALLGNVDKADKEKSSDCMNGEVKKNPFEQYRSWRSIYNFILRRLTSFIL